MLKKLVLLLIRIYQRYLSPMIAPRCRYYPTCSNYGRQAILWHGTYRGLVLTGRRVASCHPWGGSGVDFVPLPLYQWRFRPVMPELATQTPWVYVDQLYYASMLNVFLKQYS